MDPIVNEMSAEQDLVFLRTCELLQKFNKRGIELRRGTDLTSDLEIDSVAALDLIMEVEDAYDITFPMNRISELKTIGDLVDAVHQLAR